MPWSSEPPCGIAGSRTERPSPAARAPRSTLEAANRARPREPAICRGYGGKVFEHPHLLQQPIDEELGRPVGERVVEVLAPKRIGPRDPAPDTGIAGVHRLRALHEIQRFERRVE